MNREDFIKVYDIAVKILEFTANEEQPWIPPLAGSDCAELKQNGFYRGKPATLQIFADKNFPQDSSTQDFVRNEYEKIRIPGSVRLPGLLQDSFSVSNLRNMYIWERPVGERIISIDKFTAPFEPGDETAQKIAETARLIQATQESLAKLTGMIRRNSPPTLSTLMYFIKRWEKWLSYPGQHGIGNGNFVHDCQAMKWLSQLLFESRHGPFFTSWSFNFFGNTDILKTPKGEYYLINGKFELKPEGFLYAAWLWNLLMYSYKKDHDTLQDNIQQAFSLFEDREFCLGLRVYANFVERFFATMQVDVRYRRSPLDLITDTEYRNFINTLSVPLNIHGAFPLI